MKTEKFFIIKFLFNRFKDAIVVGIIIALILFVVFGKDILIQYIFGFCLGVLNFSLLTVGFDLILILKPRFAKIIHFLFFALRYLAITFVIVLFITHRNANVFSVVGGLLTMNFSIFTTEMKKHLLSRKEG